MAFSTINRAGAQTLKCDWRALRHELFEAAVDYLPYSRYCDPWPDFWDTEPFVNHLFNVSSRSHSDRVYKRALLAFDRIVAKRADNNRKSYHLSVQKSFYDCFSSERFFNPWPSMVIDKLTHIFPTLEVDLVALDFSVAASALCKIGPSVATCVLKTWVNGWITASRLQEGSVNRCVFGCSNSRDDLRHYVHCHPLWEALRVSSPFPFQLGADLLARLALVDFSPNDFKTIAAVYHFYNEARAFSKTSSVTFPVSRHFGAAKAAWRLVSLGSH